MKPTTAHGFVHFLLVSVVAVVTYLTHKVLADAVLRKTM
jgi:hypothetical protein